MFSTNEKFNIKEVNKKSIIITGGSRGIGSAIVKKYVNNNYYIHIISRNSSPFVHDITKKNQNVFFYSCDLRDIDNLKLTRQKIINNFPKIDTIISNVGDGSGEKDTIQDEREWINSWSTNFDTALNVSRIFKEDLKKTNGKILFISSIAGIEYIGAPVSYSVSKSALIALSKNLAKKLAPYIRVNAIAPGNIFCKGGTWDKKMKENPEKVNEMLKNNIPLQRFGKPEEVAELVYFINSDKAAFMTGSCIILDGGQTNIF